MITIIKLYSTENCVPFKFGLIPCISTYSLYKNKGFSSPETYWENKTYKLKRSINFETSHFSSVPFLE